MRQILTLSLLCLSLLSYSQPIGQLYYNCGPFGGSYHVSYIDYPSQNVVRIDSGISSDFHLNDDEIYISGEKIWIKDRITGAVKDSMPPNDVIHISSHGNQIVTFHQNIPYFRVFDRQTLVKIYSLDSLKVPIWASDLLVYDNKAYLSYQESVVVVDLAAHDTLATVATIHPYPNQGFNDKMVEIDGKIYISVEYATGAFRFSFMRIDPATLQVDTASHFFGGGFNRFIVAGDHKVFCLYYESYFDVIGDSLKADPAQTPPWQVVAYDEKSKTPFLLNEISGGISYVDVGGGLSNPIASGCSVYEAEFVPENQTGGVMTKDQQQKLKVYPNPANHSFYLSGVDTDRNYSLSAYDINGRLVYFDPIVELDKVIDVKSWETGIYQIVVQSRDIVINTPLVITH